MIFLERPLAVFFILLAAAVTGVRIYPTVERDPTAGVPSVQERAGTADALSVDGRS